MKVIYPNVEKLLEFHSKIIKIWLEKWEWWSFWFLWWKDESDLKSIIEFIKNDNYAEIKKYVSDHLLIFSEYSTTGEWN